MELNQIIGKGSRFVTKRGKNDHGSVSDVDMKMEKHTKELAGTEHAIKRAVKDLRSLTGQKSHIEVDGRARIDVAGGTPSYIKVAVAGKSSPCVVRFTYL